METLIPIVIVVAIFILILAYLAHRQEQERRQVYQRWAAEHPGWAYRADLDCELYCRYQFLAPFRQGRNRCVVHVFEGKWRNYISKAFSFHYKTTSSSGSGTTTTTHSHYLGAVLIHVHGVFPHLSIRPTGLLHKIGLHRSPIVLQTEEFDRKMVVETTDQQFARHFCHVVISFV